jgi:hypothetical protein
MRISSSGADLSDRDIEQAIASAKIARARFLFGPRGLGLKAIGVSACACVLAFLLIAGARSTRQQVFENTVLIERLAARLAHAEKISADTAAEISNLLRRADYDCRRIVCDALLEKRNLAARRRLQTILAISTLQADAGDR